MALSSGYIPYKDKEDSIEMLQKMKDQAFRDGVELVMNFIDWSESRHHIDLENFIGGIKKIQKDIGDLKSDYILNEDSEFNLGEVQSRISILIEVYKKFKPDKVKPNKE